MLKIKYTYLYIHASVDFDTYLYTIWFMGVYKNEHTYMYEKQEKIVSAGVKVLKKKNVPAQI